jgi:hypothetical protein
MKYFLSLLLCFPLFYLWQTLRSALFMLFLFTHKFIYLFICQIEIKTAPADFRFPTTNQTRHCFTRYVEYHRFDRILCVTLMSYNFSAFCASTFLVKTTHSYFSYQWLHLSRNSGVWMPKGTMLVIVKNLPSTTGPFALENGWVFLFLLADPFE